MQKALIGKKIGMTQIFDESRGGSLCRFTGQDR